MNKNNVDQQEVHKFSDENMDWWNPKGPMRFLHTFNPLRLQYLLSQTSLQAKKVLDIGCGAGIFAEALANEKCFLTAIDMNASALDTAKAHAQQQGLQIDYQLTSAETLAASHPEQFDVITCMEMLEHVPNPGSIIQACAAMVKPGGLVLFSTLNRTPKAFLGAIIGAEYIANLLPKGTHEYKKFIRPSEMSQWANEAQLTFQHIQGVSFNPLTQQPRLSSSVQINYMACFRRGE